MLYCSRDQLTRLLLQTAISVGSIASSVSAIILGYISLLFEVCSIAAAQGIGDNCGNKRHCGQNARYSLAPSRPIRASCRTIEKKTAQMNAGHDDVGAYDGTSDGILEHFSVIGSHWMCLYHAG